MDHVVVWRSPRTPGLVMRRQSVLSVSVPRAPAGVAVAARLLDHSRSINSVASRILPTPRLRCGPSAAVVRSISPRRAPAPWSCARSPPRHCQGFHQPTKCVPSLSLCSWAWPSAVSRVADLGPLDVHLPSPSTSTAVIALITLFLNHSGRCERPQAVAAGCCAVGGGGHCHGRPGARGRGGMMACRSRPRGSQALAGYPYQQHVGNMAWMGDPEHVTQGVAQRHMRRPC